MGSRRDVCRQGLIPDDRPILAWLMRYTSTPWERVAGKRPSRAVAELGAKVMLMVEGPWKENQWSFGSWQRPAMRTHEAYHGTTDVVIRGWTNKRTGAGQVDSRRRIGRPRSTQRLDPRWEREGVDS